MPSTLFQIIIGSYLHVRQASTEVIHNPLCINQHEQCLVFMITRGRCSNEPSWV